MREGQVTLELTVNTRLNGRIPQVVLVDGDVLLVNVREAAAIALAEQTEFGGCEIDKISWKERRG